MSAQCVSCGRRYVGDNHKCSASHVAARESAMSRENNGREVPEQTKRRDAEVMADVTITSERRHPLGYSRINGSLEQAVLPPSDVFNLPEARLPEPAERIYDFEYVRPVITITNLKARRRDVPIADESATNVQAQARIAGFAARDARMAKRRPAYDAVRECHNAGMKTIQIIGELERRGFKPEKGDRWNHSTVYDMVQRIIDGRVSK